MKLGLQIGLGLMSLIPFLDAILGVAFGIDSESICYCSIAMPVDSQYRYLSTVNLLVPILIWWMIPNIERHGKLLFLVLGVVFLGGIARLGAYYGTPTLGQSVFEIGIGLSFPVFLFWQRLVARKSASA